jgi:hypothetical protein
MLTNNQRIKIERLIQEYKDQGYSANYYTAEIIAKVLRLRVKDVENVWRQL